MGRFFTVSLAPSVSARSMARCSASSTMTLAPVSCTRSRGPKSPNGSASSTMTRSTWGRSVSAFIALGRRRHHLLDHLGELTPGQLHRHSLLGQVVVDVHAVQPALGQHLRHDVLRQLAQVQRQRLAEVGRRMLVSPTSLRAGEAWGDTGSTVTVLSARSVFAGVNIISRPPPRATSWVAGQEKFLTVLFHLLDACLPFGTQPSFLGL